MYVDGEEGGAAWKGYSSSREAPYAKALGKEGAQYILGTDRRSVGLKTEERKEQGVWDEAQDGDRSKSQI